MERVERVGGRFFVLRWMGRGLLATAGVAGAYACAYKPVDLPVGGGTGGSGQVATGGTGQVMNGGSTSTAGSSTPNGGSMVANGGSMVANGGSDSTAGTSSSGGSGGAAQGPTNPNLTFTKL